MNYKSIVELQDNIAKFTIVDRIWISVWHALPKAEQLRKGKLLVHGLIQKHGNMGALIVLAPGAERGMLGNGPSDEIRELTSDIFGMFNQSPESAIAVSIPATGFLGATVRSLFSGGFLLVRPKFSTKIANNTQDAITWLLSKLIKSTDYGPLRRAITEHIDQNGMFPP